MARYLVSITLMPSSGNFNRVVSNLINSNIAIAINERNFISPREKYSGFPGWGNFKFGTLANTELET